MRTRAPWVGAFLLALGGTALLIPATSAQPCARPGYVRGPDCPVDAQDTAGCCPHVTLGARNRSPNRREMVRVSGGTFWMGSAEGDDLPNTHPPTQVTLDPYYLDRTEVTVEAYLACVHTGTCSPAASTTHSGIAQDACYSGAPDTWCDVTGIRHRNSYCNGSRTDRRSHPVNCVDWHQADAYCRWAGKRLPTEAEWEFAARGTDGRRFPWGNRPPTVRHLQWPGSGRHGTVSVGRYPAGASPFGLLDMSGNVWEWVADIWGPYPGGSNHNPAGPPRTPSSRRVNRGGSWRSDRVRATARFGDLPGLRESDLGFRCAQDV